MQSFGEVAPMAVEYVPALHSVQFLAPKFVNVPALQRMQEAELEAPFAVEKVPALQTRQDWEELAPAITEYEPASH